VSATHIDAADNIFHSGGFIIVGPGEGARVRSGGAADFTDVIVDAFGAGFGFSPAVGIELVSAVHLLRVEVRNVHTFQLPLFIVNPPMGFASVHDSVLQGGSTVLSVDGDSSEIVGNTLTGGQEGLGLSGSQHLVFHNNIFGNAGPQVFSTSAIELSDTRASSPTFQQGNFFGHACPGPLFTAGVDSNQAGVVDSFPYGQASAWLAGEAPGCALAAPVIRSPLSGTITHDALLAVEGTAAAGSRISIRSDGVEVGATVADSAGNFSGRPSTPLSDGAHVITAIATAGGRTSPESNPARVTIDTTTPAAPRIVFPLPGAQLADGDVAISGTAESATLVTVLDGTQTIGSVFASADGSFLVSPTSPLITGSHTITARATDAAGNSSTPAASVTFTITAPSAATPLLGSRGYLAIRSTFDAPDPFSTEIGPNVLTVTGDFAPAAGNSFIVLVERKFLNPDTMEQVAVATSSTPVVRAPASGRIAFSVQNSWDGKSSGTLVPPRTYLAATRVMVTRGVPGKV
jgi:hypothetical protein